MTVSSPLTRKPSPAPPKKSLKKYTYFKVGDSPKDRSGCGAFHCKGGFRFAHRFISLTCARNKGDMNAPRVDGRRSDELRGTRFHNNIAPHATGSTLIEWGSTRVICGVTVE